MKLALFGGIPVRQAPWPKWPIGSKKASELLNEVLDSGRWSVRGWYSGSQSKTLEFASRFAEFNGVDYCVPTNSGSASLLLALEALDIGYGDEVIVPVYTWVATAIAVLNVNAVPVFVDVDSETGCIDPKCIEAAISPRTKAILVVHLHSSICEMDEILKIANRTGLYVIEDCAQAHGAMYGGKKVGTIGDLGVFSMNQEKVLCCGEGGAVITKSHELYERVFRLHADGSMVNENTPAIGQYELEDREGLMGGNYTLSEFQAAILLSELDFLEQRNELRRKNAEYLTGQLAQLGLDPVSSSRGTTARTYFKYAIRIVDSSFRRVEPERLADAISAELGFRLEQTECKPLHQNILYCPTSKSKHRAIEADTASTITSLRSFKNAEEHYQTTLVFHHSVLLSGISDMKDIVEAFGKVKKYLGDL